MGELGRVVRLALSPWEVGEGAGVPGVPCQEVIQGLTTGQMGAPEPTTTAPPLRHPKVITGLGLLT